MSSAFDLGREKVDLLLLTLNAVVLSLSILGECDQGFSPESCELRVHFATFGLSVEACTQDVRLLILKLLFGIGSNTMLRVLCFSHLGGSIDR